jgi:hypothetical protein
MTLLGKTSHVQYIIYISTSLKLGRKAIILQKKYINVHNNTIKLILHTFNWIFSTTRNRVGQKQIHRRISRFLVTLYHFPTFYRYLSI